MDLLSPVPAYEQVRQQVRTHVTAGLLRAGDRLPTVRALSARLGLATNTVARAYRELEGDGLVTTRRRVGTVVTARPGATGSPEDDAVVAAVDRLVLLADEAGVDEDRLVALVRAALLRNRTAPVPSPG